tara:strand:- start:344 stop:1678 length:1335 start_codon:yes stop_codon:yes gene_type:complete
MHTDLPKTINEALKILAYNDYFWEDSQKGRINPHNKDIETVKSLAEAQYAWTEKQAKLAVVILKRYLTKFQKHGMDIKKLLDHPVYDDAFRVISFEKTIEKYIDEDENKIDLKFPYTKKIIQLVRCLKDKKGLPSSYARYDGESKTWSFKQTDVTTYYLTLIAVRYDFKFIDETLLNEYDAVKSEIKNYKQPTAHIVGGHVVLNDAPESLQDYWEKNLKDKKVVQQVDALKNLYVQMPNDINITTETYTAKKIALCPNHKIWIDRNEYSRDEVIAGLKELDAFPIVMPVSGEISSAEDIEEYWHWIKAFERNGIDPLKEMSWGFDLKEPKREKDIEESVYKEFVIGNNLPNEKFEQLFELHQMSKQFKYIDSNTKVMFVRNRIPRSLMKSNVKPKVSLVTLGGGYFSSGTDNLKRLLDNLPKKLYYSDSQPSSWDWHDNIIIKL